MATSVDDREFLAALFTATHPDLPEPKKEKEKLELEMQ